MSTLNIGVVFAHHVVTTLNRTGSMNEAFRELQVRAGSLEQLYACYKDAEVDNTLVGSKVRVLHDLYNFYQHLTFKYALTPDNWDLGARMKINYVIDSLAALDKNKNNA